LQLRPFGAAGVAVAGLLLHAACSGGHPGPADAGPLDTTPPALLSSSPAAGASGVPATSVVTATFSEPIDPGSADASTFLVEDAAHARVPGSVVVSGSTAVFTPAARFGYASEYCATVTRVRDAAGNRLAVDVTWCFTTAALPDTSPPVITAVAPMDGASGVTPDAVVSATFDEVPYAPSSGAASLALRAAGGSAVAGSVTLQGSSVFFTPAVPLANATTYVATVARGVRDLAGNALANDYVWSFATAPAPGAIGPVVIAEAPLHGACDVPVGAVISATFDAAIDPSTVDATTFALHDRRGTDVLGTFTVSGATVMLAPYVPLRYWTTYDVALSTGIQDVAKHPLQGAAGWSFTTEADLLHPLPLDVVVPSPPEGGTNVVAGATIAALLNMGYVYDPASVDASSFRLVDAAGAPVAGTLSVRDGLAMLTPAEPLTPGTRYTATLTTAVRDDAGTPLSAPVTWSFTTVPPGLFDEAFGAGGTIATREGSARAVLVQPDGKVLVAGSAPGAYGPVALLLRYTADGRPDDGFGNAGEVVYDGGYLGPWANTAAVALALQADGKILLAGRTYQGPGTLGDAFILRYDVAGALDPTFGAGGAVLHQTASDAYAVGVAVQPDGKLVLASYECPAATCNVVLLRYGADGSPDATFGTDGQVTYPNSEVVSDIVSGIAVDGAGRLLVQGSADLRRLASDGSLDATFGAGGVVEGNATTFALAPGGEIARARIVQDAVDGSLRDVAVERRLPGGALDTSFGVAGLATWRGSGTEEAPAVAIAANGSVTVAGTTRDGNPLAHLLRFAPSGALDPSFGTGGEVTCCGVGPVNYTTATALAVQTDGKTVFAGSFVEWSLYRQVSRVLVGRLH